MPGLMAVLREGGGCFPGGLDLLGAALIAELVLYFVGEQHPSAPVRLFNFGRMNLRYMRVDSTSNNRNQGGSVPPGSDDAMDV